MLVFFYISEKIPIKCKKQKSHILEQLQITDHCEFTTTRSSDDWLFWHEDEMFTKTTAQKTEDDEEV